MSEHPPRTRARPLVKSELQLLCSYLNLSVVALVFISLAIGSFLIYSSSLVIHTKPSEADRQTVSGYLASIRAFLARAPAVVATLSYQQHETEPHRVAKVSWRAAGGSSDPPDDDEPTRGPENPDFDFNDEDDDEDDDEDEKDEDRKKDKAARTVQRFWRLRQRRLRPPANPNPFRHSPFFWNMYDIKSWMTRVFAARTIQRAWRDYKDFGSELLLDHARASAAETCSEARESESRSP